MSATKETVTTPIEDLSDDFVELPVIKKRRGERDSITANFKRRYTYRWLPFDSLNVDPTYQRKLQSAKASVMAHNWNTDKEGAMVVSRRINGKYYIIDGQHRYMALRAIENHPPRIYCQVFTGLTQLEEAKLFHDLDSERDNLTPGASFKALVASEDPAAIAITRAAQRAGLTVNYDRGPKPNNVRAFKTLQDLYRRQGSMGLERILRICHRAWPEHNDSASHSMMLGLEVFLMKYGDQVSEKRLIETLSKNDPKYIINMGRSINGTLSSTIYPAIAIAIRSIYNKNLTPKNRLPESI